MQTVSYNHVKINRIYFNKNYTERNELKVQESCSGKSVQIEKK